MLAKNRLQRLLTRLNSREGQSYGRMVRRNFRRNRYAMASLRLLQFLLFVALFADFLANEKPLYCRFEGKTYFPVLHEYAVGLNLVEWPGPLVGVGWHDLDYEQALFPPVPYSPQSIDRKNMGYRRPLGPQRVESWRFRHWMGTDRIGRDVLAGMIRGTRIALAVGLIAMSIASLVGILLGSLAGFFGDDRLRTSRVRLLLNLAGGAAGLFIAFQARTHALRAGPWGPELLKSLGLFALILLIANLAATPLERLFRPARRLAIPCDLLVMRLIEVINSIPTLLLILAVAAIVRRPSVFYVMVIIGLIGWTTIARFVRSELLRIRRQEYVEAGRALGFSEWHILFRHALPNALTPVLITVAFGIASAILIEASLSFLGVGVGADMVTWGSLLNLARANSQAWWLAVFPGLAIFLTVTAFNLVGEGLTEALDPQSTARSLQPAKQTED